MIDREKFIEPELLEDEKSLLDKENTSGYDDTDDNSGTPISVITAVVTYCLYKSVSNKHTR